MAVLYSESQAGLTNVCAITVQRSFAIRSLARALTGAASSLTYSVLGVSSETRHSVN